VNRILDYIRGEKGMGNARITRTVTSRTLRVTATPL